MLRKQNEKTRKREVAFYYIVDVKLFIFTESSASINLNNSLLFAV